MSEEEARTAKCREPLPLDAVAIRAFADRQAKLVAQSRWPSTSWYNDEDFCRAYNTAVQLQSDVERLRASLSRYETLNLTGDELSALIEACNHADQHGKCRPPWDRAGRSAWRKLIEEERYRLSSSANAGLLSGRG